MTVRCCVQCLVTRGPHTGASVVVCRDEATLAAPLLSMGRRKLCQLRLLRDLEVSSTHAEVWLEASSQKAEEAKDEDVEVLETKRAVNVVVRDVKSTNGSKLNGQPLSPLENYVISDGDLIGVGRSSVRVRFVEHNTSAASEPQQPGKAQRTASLATATGPQARRAHEGAAAEDASDTSERFGTLGNQEGVDPAVAEPADGRCVDDQRDAQAGSKATNRSHDPPERPRRVERDEDDAFESPKQIIRRVASGNTRGGASAGSSRRTTCMVCGQWLGLMDVMDQQLHINACLDGMPSHVPESATTVLMSRKGRASRPTKPSKKRKRRGALDPEQEQLTLAMALSKSLAGEGQQVDMQLALVRQELGHIDAQMAKLTKKRAALIKSMTKLEKKATRLRKSRVRPPAEVRALLRLELALDSMFPRDREADTRLPTDVRPNTVKRKRWVYQLQQEGDDTAMPSLGLSCLSQPEPETLLQDGEADDFVSMWARASQRPDFDQRERQVYYNSVLRGFLPVDAPATENYDAENLNGVVDEAKQDKPDSTHAEDNAEDWMPMQERDASNGAVEATVPDTVKRAFPNWREDLAFLQERSAEELREALDELIRAREDGHLALLTQSQVPTDANEQQLQDSEREEACVYMESVMQRLLKQKEQVDSASGTVVEEQQQPTIELLDDDGEGETEDATRSETLYRGSDVPGSFDSVISISDSDEELESREDVVSTNAIEENVDQGSFVYPHRSFSATSSTPSSSDDERSQGSGDDEASPAGVMGAVADEPGVEDGNTQEVATQAVTHSFRDEGPASPVREMSPTSITSGDTGNTSSDGGKPLLTGEEEPKTIQAATNSNKGADHDTDSDMCILEALRADEALYECVLVLRPLPLPTVLAHLRSVGLKYARQVVTSALDRHGITFCDRAETR